MTSPSASGPATQPLLLLATVAAEVVVVDVVMVTDADISDDVNVLSSASAAHTSTAH